MPVELDSYAIAEPKRRTVPMSKKDGAPGDDRNDR